MSVEEPAYKPQCCGQTSKWVLISSNLSYFYCTVCRDEVPVGGGKPRPKVETLPVGGEELFINETLKLMGEAAAAIGHSSLGSIGQHAWGAPIPVPKYPSPPQLKFQVGDTLLRLATGIKVTVIIIDYAKKEYLLESEQGPIYTDPFHIVHRECIKV